MTVKEEQDARCPVEDCAYKEDCEIIRITGKKPEQGKKCSYYANEKSSGGRRASRKSEKEEESGT